MKTFTKLLIAILGLLFSPNAFSQDNAKSLVARGGRSMILENTLKRL